MPLLSRLGVAWILGIALASWLNIPWQATILAALLALVALLLYQHAPRPKLTALLLLAFAAGAFRFNFSGSQ